MSGKKPMPKIRKKPGGGGGGGLVGILAGNVINATNNVAELKALHEATKTAMEVLPSIPPEANVYLNFS